MKRLLILLLPVLGFAKEIPVNDGAEIQTAAASAQPGDVLIMREGEWRDVVVIFSAQGAPKIPVTLRAAVPGKTILTGKSTLRMSGEHLVVEGLHFKDPDPTVSDLIDFRKDSKTKANHCRLTNCAITSEAQQDSSKESRWIGIYGQQNRVDHCLIQGKTGKGTTLVVWLNQEGDGKHRIEYNHFGPREKLGKNGGETIRVGDSKTSMLTAACVVQRNLFEKCNGEAECISNKSCGNIYSENTFLEVSGTLTLRHGNGCMVEVNGFFGNHANGTGGIRIIGEDHVVRGNYLEKLAGDDARSGITFMLGIPDSRPHGYFQVKRARVEDNTLVDCEHPILIGMKGSTVEGKVPSLPPLDCVMQGNRVNAPESTVVEARCDIASFQWSANQFLGKALGIPETKGIEQVQPRQRALQPIPRALVGPAWLK